MQKSGFPYIMILIIILLAFSGCISTSSPPVKSAPSGTPDSEYSHLMLSPADLPAGFSRVSAGQMPASDLSELMRIYGAVGGYRVLYANKIPPTTKARVLEQDILEFNGANATVMLDETNASFNALKSKTYTPLYLPDPGIGEKSFAVKNTITDPAGAETNYYIAGFVKSGFVEIFSMQATPSEYPAFLHAVQQASEKIS